MTAHTRGPWEVSTHFMHTQWVVESTVEHAEICQDRAWGNKYEAESLANARLIAAAPELLEALQFFVAPFAGLEVVPDGFIAKARAAIAKATGASNGR